MKPNLQNQLIITYILAALKRYFAVKQTRSTMTKRNALFPIAGFILTFIFINTFFPVNNQVTASHAPADHLSMEGYFWSHPPVDSNQIFPTSNSCKGCHQTDPDSFAMYDNQGNDVNMHDDWVSSMMGNSAKDPFWRAKVSHEVLLHPAYTDDIETKCTSCHAPMGHFTAISRGHEHYTMEDLLADTVGLDGVSCGTCHMTSRDSLGLLHSGNMKYDTNRIIYGPYEFPLAGPMRDFVGFLPEYSEHINDAGICASCHTLVTQPFDLQGNPTGTDYIEQATYHEWLNSDYNTEAVSCQACHMPRIEDSVVISDNYAILEGRTPYGLHELVGANTTMLKLMRDNRRALDINASLQDYEETIAATTRMLQEQSLDLELELIEQDADSLYFNVSLVNKAGHKFPSGYPSRRLFLNFIALTSNGDTLLHSGEFDWRYALKDLDEGYEPHYEMINSSDQVQVYQMVSGDTENGVTTVLERAFVTLKDNRLPPRGFSTDHYTYDTTKIYGRALNDPNFNKDNSGTQGTGGDMIRYHVPLEGFAGIVEVRVKAYYQSLPPRWMEEIFEASTPEIDFFRSLFDKADQSAVLVASDTISDIVVVQTSIKTVAEAGITLSPNPTSSGLINLTYPQDFTASSTNIYDVQGRLIQSFANPPTVISLPYSGLFIVEWLNGKERIIEKVVH